MHVPTRVSLPRWCRIGSLVACSAAVADIPAGCRTPGAPTPGITEIWFHAQPGTGFTKSRPEVVGDVVVFGSASGHLIAREVTPGGARWTTAMCGDGGPQARNFVVAAGAIVAECESEALAVDVATGQIRWRYRPPLDTTYDDLPGVVAGSHPATDGTSVYVPAWGASVSAISAATGATRWVWNLGRLSSDTAANVFRAGAGGTAVSGDTVFVTCWHWTTLRGGTSEALLVALDRDTGAELWKLLLPEKTSGGAISAPPVLVSDLAILLNQDGGLFAVRRSTGQLAWKYRSPAYRYGTIAAPVVVGDTIYASLGDEELTALRAADGVVLWSVGPLGATKDLFATDRRVYVPRDGYLNIHHRASGALIATGRVRGTDGAAFITSASALGDQIFITSTQGAWSFREPD